MFIAPIVALRTTNGYEKGTVDTEPDRFGGESGESLVGGHVVDPHDLAGTSRVQTRAFTGGVLGTIELQRRSVGGPPQ
ncbi:MAG: hypothetical protein ABIQ73_29515 [Acidimicrobiales bacterium]